MSPRRKWVLSIYDQGYYAGRNHKRQTSTEETYRIGYRHGRADGWILRKPRSKQRKP